MNLTLSNPENLKYETFLRDTLSYLNTGIKFVVIDLDDDDLSDSGQNDLSDDISEAVASGDIETTGRSVTIEEVTARIDKALTDAIE